MTHPLPLTGERTLPGVRGEEYWFARHEAAYRWIATTFGAELRGSLVVEAGSGEGYGAALLRESGPRLVLALEYDEPSARHADATYPGVVTARANLATLPLAPGSADVVVSLQVVEHLWDLDGFLRGCFAALRPGGLLVISTPNRPAFSPGLGRGEKPTNPFHVEEFDAGQVETKLLAAGFSDVAVHGLHHGPRIARWEEGSGVAIVAAQVAAASGTGSTTTALDEMIATITLDDFEIGAPELAQDLIATARRP